MKISGKYFKAETHTDPATRVSSTAVFVRFTQVVSLPSVCCTLWDDNSIRSSCVANSKPEKEIRLLSSFDYNHDLSGALLFCIKLNFMITLIALFMSCFCHYAPSNCLALLFQRLTSYSDVTKPKSFFISYFMFTDGLRRYFRVRDEPNRISVT